MEKFQASKVYLQLATLLAAVLFFLRDIVDIVGRFYAKRMKK